MAKACEKCGKSPLSGFNVSHSNKRTKRRQLPNLKKARVFLSGRWERLLLCTRCLRTLAKAK